MRQLTRRQVLGSALAGTALSCWGPRAAAQEARKQGFNVLFFAVDDLRPQLGCYGDPVVKSPNLDKLASEGLLFNRAYCQQAVCSPSRTSLLTGRRPDTTKVYELKTHFRKTIPDVVTLPQQFKANGYFTLGMGKIYHGGLDDEASWSVPHWRPKAEMYHRPENKKLIERLTREAKERGWSGKTSWDRPRGPAWEDPDVPDNALRDGMVADKAIATLNEIKGRPFFLAVGFYKPHLPFVAPKRYWDLYKKDQLTLADNPFAPKDAPQYALTNWGELRHYHGMPNKGPVTDEQALELIHGYYACTSYTDAQIGRVVAELERLGLREKTVIIMWGDHGWQLGEHGLWCKHTNFETSVRVPMLICVPGQPNAGAKTDALVEFVDIYPSLCDVCGLPLSEGLEGTSFIPLIKNPKRAWKKAALSQYPRGVKGVGRVMGYSMRTERYRFTEWRGLTKEFAEYELYDHVKDPKENVNIANRPENAELVTQLRNLLHAGWQEMRPPA